MNMIRPSKELIDFENEMIKNNRPDYEKNLAIVEAMLVEAIELGVIPLKDPLDDIQTVVKIAKVINSV